MTPVSGPPSRGDDEPNPLAGFGEMLQSLGRMMTAAAGERSTGLTAAALRQGASTHMPSHRIVDTRLTQAVDAAGELANMWLDAATSLPSSGSLRAWSPQEWLEATAAGWVNLANPVIDGTAGASSAALTSLTSAGDPDAPQPAVPLPLATIFERICAGVLHQQLAQTVARLSASTLSLHEVPVDLAGGAAVLPHAVEEWAVDLGVPKDQALLWCAMREVALARLLEAHPWISRAITDGLAACAASLQVDAQAIEDAMEGIDLTNLSSMPDLWGSGAMEAKPTAAGMAAAARVETLVTLVESWADTVIGAAAAGRLPAHAAMCEAYHRRRQSASPTKDLLDSLLGVDVSGRKLRVAQGVWDYIAGKHGVAARDRLWSHPDLLPTTDDLTDPTDFLAALNSEPLTAGGSLDAPEAN